MFASNSSAAFGGTLNVPYVPSGRLRWERFLLGSLLSVVLAIGMAWCLYQAFRVGWYVMVLAPMLAALPVLAAVRTTVSWSHCRSKLLATVLGLFAALLVHPGHYHVAMLDFIGWQNAHRIDVLPLFMDFRMHTDVVEDLHQPQNRNQNRGQVHRGPDVVRNWVFCILEIVCVAGIVASGARLRAARAYCEQCECWMRSQSLKLAGNSGSQIMKLLSSGQVSELANIPSPDSSAPVVCELTIDYCPASKRAASRCPVYLTLKEATVTGSRRKKVKSTTLLSQVELDDTQVASLVLVFPVLQPAVPGAPQTPAVQGVIDRLPSSAGALAEVVDVPPPYGGRVLRLPHLIVGSVLNLSLLLILLSGFGLLGLAAYLAESVPAWISGTLGVSGIGMFALTALLASWYGDYLPSRYLYRVTKREMELRPVRWVEPRDPEAIYIQVVPRENWTHFMFENASDVGFLRIDGARRQLLFEGDKQRYCIPAESIVACGIEFFTMPADRQQRQIFSMVSIRAHTANGLWETMIAHRHIWLGKRNNATRLQKAEELRAKIASLLPPSPAGSSVS